MTDTAQQLLRDPEVKPSNQQISDGLGASFKWYVAFIEELKNYGISLMDWRYYNDGKAWLSKGEYKWVTSRGNHKVKPIFWLSIWDGFFKVSFFFSEKIRAQLLDLPLSDDTKERIKNTAPHGKSMQYLSLIFDVKNDQLLDDIYILAQFRKEKI
ncbi:DUF3788 family protein [Enterococcus termitis]|uniref:DUF3788 domain-containing protein n=1 Tax=Enterococcus termitis TaxID=332950 RepID=A0A1E5GSW3_9ENTE|nr:DUF3788 family protein [Enterococcus termitis]OEG15782.1 hypothetical protein BCR25_18725 [Enterococcus termitis]OJG96668.1 hypothetical protein RV18_GL002034 [Enterococcus termitis]